MSSDIAAFEVAAATRLTTTEDGGTMFRVPDLMPKAKEGEAPPEQTFTEVIAYEPDEGQFAVLLATTGRGVSPSERVAGMINFFVNILDDAGADYLIGRLLTPPRKDPFGIEQVEEILERLTRAWTGNPTREPSGSQPSPSSDGQKSTAPTPLLT